MAAPATPSLRAITGAIGETIVEVITFITALARLPMLWGKETKITVGAGDVGATLKITTGIGYPVTGFFVVRGGGGSRPTEVARSATDTDYSNIYLTFPAAGTYTLWVY